jgi:hypothetical protein
VRFAEKLVKSQAGSFNGGEIEVLCKKQKPSGENNFALKAPFIRNAARAILFTARTTDSA